MTGSTPRAAPRARSASRLSVISTEHRRERSRLLRALPLEEYSALHGRLESVTLASGTPLSEGHQPIVAVYFPRTAVVSLLTPMPDANAVEIALVGSEGMVGVALVSGAQSSATRAVVQVSGDLCRMSTRDFRHARAVSPAFDRVTRRYVNTLLEQIAQSAACNQRHMVRARCARWMLMAQDRTGADRFGLTQAFLGEMLDVRRQTVSAAASELQHAGLIRYSRGQLTVTDRVGLKSAACACYQIMLDDEARASGAPRANS